MPIDTVSYQTTALATPPATTKVAVDDLPAGVGVAQYVKLLDGAENSVTPVLADTNGLNVSVKAGGYALPVTFSGAPNVTIAGPNPLPVSGNVALPAGVNVNNFPASQAVTFAGGFSVDTELPPAATLAGDTLTGGALGPSGAPAVQAVNLGWNGTNYDRVRVANAGAQVAASAPGVLVVQGTGPLGAIPISGSISAGGVNDRSAFTPGPGVGSSVTPVGYVLDDTATNTPAEDQIGAARMDPKRAQIMVLEDYSTAGPTRRVGVNAAHELLVGGTGTVVAPSAGILTIQGPSTADGAPVRVAPIHTDNGGFANSSGGVYPMAMERNDAATTDPGNNSLGVPRITATRQQIMVIEDGTGGGTRGQRAAVSTRGGLVVEGVAGGVAVPVSGAFWQTTQPVSTPGLFPVQDSEKLADDAAFGIGTSKVLPVGFLADETATDSVDEGDIGAARMTLDRVQRVVMEHEGASLRDAGTALTVKRAKIGVHGSGINALVTAVAAKRIRVLAMFVIAGAASSIYFSNNTTGAVFGDATDTIDLLANEAFVLPFNPAGWFQTGTANEDLRLVTNGANRMSGGLVYVEV